MTDILAPREPVGVSYPSIVVGVTEIAVSYAQLADAATFRAYERALGDKMTESEWREVVRRAVEYKTEKPEWTPKWWTPGMLLALLDVIRAEAAQIAGGKPADTELRALEAQADAEASRP